MKYVISTFLIILSASLYSQNIKGTVMTEEEKFPLAYANIYWKGSSVGTQSGPKGAFEIEAPREYPAELIFSYVGKKSDTLTLTQFPVEPIKIELKNQTIKTFSVEGQQFSSKMNMKSAYLQEDISEQELQKAACCNLSESFETNSSIDMRFTDAVTGIKRIQMLGLDGAYTLIQMENLPHVRGVTANTGLTYIPGNWIESIQLIKGSGSIVNGYESITGHINLEYKKPDAKDEKLFLNLYSNAMGRLELNSFFRHRLNKKWSTMLFANAHGVTMQNDNNNDGFLDMPLEEGFHLFNRWKYKSKRIGMQFGVSGLADRKRGGQSFGNLERTNLFRYDKQTERLEFFFKSGLLFPDSPDRSTAILLKGRTHNEDGVIGNRSYFSSENFFHTNWIYQNLLTEEKDQIENTYRFGASFLYDYTEQGLADQSFTREELVPGVFGELSFTKEFAYSMVLGLRSDFHNLYGTRLSPRAHFKYYFPTRTVARLAIGKGFRAPNPFSEYQSGLISSRTVILNPSLNAESAWNGGLAITQNFFFVNRDASFSIDLFHTRFENQLVADFENKDLLVFSNLEGESYSSAIQGEITLTPLKRFELKASAKYYDVKVTYSGVLKQKPMVPIYRALVNTSYATKNKKWKWDATAQLIGQSRLASTQGNAIQNVRSTTSELYYLLNSQIRRDAECFEIYAGVENILNFIQTGAIIDPDNPFGPEFDASMVWGPVNGRVIYLGINLKLFKP